MHRTYDGEDPPFTIGLRALDPGGWIQVDEFLVEQLDEKDRLFEVHHEDVFQAEDDTVPAQREVLDELLTYLPVRYPEIYTVGAESISVRPTGKRYVIADFDDRPLELAARLVEDDLVLMRKEDGRHRLVAAALCFPTGWSLRDKFGHAMTDVHGPVPGFGQGSRNARLIERIFGNLKSGQPVERHNWSLFDQPNLYYPTSDHAGSGLIDAAGLVNAWIRIERQTLSKLPQSGFVLFTIKIVVDPLGALKRMPQGVAMAASLRGQIKKMDDAQLEYKGLTEVHEDICRELRAIEQATGKTGCLN